MSQLPYGYFGVILTSRFPKVNEGGGQFAREVKGADLVTPLFYEH